jgi:hypothetical protein
VPLFVETDDGLEGVDLNFNGWGDKQEHPNDAYVARELLREFEIPRVQADLVAEGGSFETDGFGTLLVTESSLVNENRNPGLSRDDVEARLRTLLGMTKVIWFDGVYGEDITDAHVDSLVRFAGPGVVLLDTPGPVRRTMCGRVRACRHVRYWPRRRMREGSGSRSSISRNRTSKRSGRRRGLPRLVCELLRRQRCGLPA